MTYGYQTFFELVLYRFSKDLALLADQSWRKASHYECCSERVYPAISRPRFRGKAFENRYYPVKPLRLTRLDNSKRFYGDGHAPGVPTGIRPAKCPGKDGHSRKGSPLLCESEPSLYARAYHPALHRCE